MARVVINEPQYPRQFNENQEAPKGNSWMGLSGGWFFYSNNPESVYYWHLADQGKWLNRASVRGEGQVYTWHHNSTGFQISTCILIYNPNSYDIVVSSYAHGTTKKYGAQPDSDAWINFWNTSSPIYEIVPANGYKAIFQRTIEAEEVFGVIARLNITSTNGNAAEAVLFDLIYSANSSGATSAANPDGTSRPRGIGATGYWLTTQFDTLTPVDQNGQYYTLGAFRDTFGGADVPYINDPSGQAPNHALGNYGQQINISLPIYNNQSWGRTYRIFVGSTGGNLFPCFYYQGGGYKLNNGGWGNIEHHHILDILEQYVGAHSTETVSFQMVVPAVSSTPLVVGARLA
ncbi:hypothetical protein P4H70_06715 [Paenibacillus ehimensis]|uniref:hypothetical protein n=1 Tax=Paenibacillus ehimensis TaxID=79264 RepID=UPI002DB574C6|nr:hypothetical protein [Paenibacillus ehimensis]MEC0208640.1 hypothetical protein [Paenibacillus ehimensis]